MKKKKKLKKKKKKNIHSSGSIVIFGIGKVLWCVYNVHMYTMFSSKQIL